MSRGNSWAKPMTDLRTERTIFENQSAWIKRPEPARGSMYVPLHQLLRVVLPTALHPTNSTGGMAGLRREAERLQEFFAAGLPVPEVLCVGEDQIILSDCGKSLRVHMENLTDQSALPDLITRALDLLTDIHVAGLAHGRPHLKDYLIEPETGALSILDFEEDPTATMSLADAQARDFWLFLGAVCEFHEAPEAVLRGLIEQYSQKAPDDTKQALKKLAKALRPFRRLIGFLRAERLGRDVHGTYWATRVLETV